MGSNKRKHIIFRTNYRHQDSLHVAEPHKAVPFIYFPPQFMQTFQDIFNHRILPHIQDPHTIAEPFMGKQQHLFFFMGYAGTKHLLQNPKKPMTDLIGDSNADTI